MPTAKIKRSYRKTRYILYKETLIDYKEQFWSFLGSFVGIGLIAYFQSKQFSHQDAVYLIGSFGASSVLVLWNYRKSVFTTKKFGWRPSYFSYYRCYD